MEVRTNPASINVPSAASTYTGVVASSSSSIHISGPSLSSTSGLTSSSKHQHHQQQPAAGAGAQGYTISGPAGPVTAAAAVKQCAGCGGDILDRYLLHAIDLHWHTGCLRCAVCHSPLADIGSTCFTRAGLILCRADYIRMFGLTGSCAACGQTIQPNELVLRTPSSSQHGGGGVSGGSSGSVYHVQCFSCVACHCRLVAGDRYRVINGHVVCGDHDFPPQHQQQPASQLPHPGTSQQQQQQAAAKQQQMAMMMMTSGSTNAKATAASGVTSSSSTSHGGGGRARQKVC